MSLRVCVSVCASDKLERFISIHRGLLRATRAPHGCNSASTDGGDWPEVDQMVHFPSVFSGTSQPPPFSKNQISDKVMAKPLGL